MTTATATDELRQRLTIPPAGCHSHNPVAIAHAALERLRDEGDVQFLFLRTILEQGRAATVDEELLFHCLTGLRQVILTIHWKTYSSHFVTTVRDFCMILGHYSNNRPCRMACYSTSVAIWKRSWLEEGTNNSTTSAEHESLILHMTTFLDRPVLPDRSALFNYFQQSLPRQLAPITAYMTCLVDEFCGKSAVTYRMPLQFHREAHKSFEKQGALHQCLQLSLPCLGNSLRSGGGEIDICLQIQLILSVLGWEFGKAGYWSSQSTHALIRPPAAWRDLLIQPELCKALIQKHAEIENAELQHNLRQLLLTLASITGSIFPSEDSKLRQAFASSLVECTLQLFQKSSESLSPDDDHTCLNETLQLIGRISANYRLSCLIHLATLSPMLEGLASIGRRLLADQVRQAEETGGEYVDEWREEALNMVLENAVLLCTDPWLLYTTDSRLQAQRSLAVVLGPLYEGYVNCRTRLASLEEHYIMTHEAELDEVREAILEADLEEELDSVACVGRLNLPAAVKCLSDMFGKVMPPLETLWGESGGEVSAEAAAYLEQARLLNLYISHLLTDDNSGEEPAIPDGILLACNETPALSSQLADAVRAVFSFAEAQSRKIVEQPTNTGLSPILASSFLTFLTRWAPAYILPKLQASQSHQHVQEWSVPEKAKQAVNFCLQLCLRYHCYWPHEAQVQKQAGALLLALVRRGAQVRALVVASPAFQELFQLHCLAATVRHSAGRQEFEAHVQQRLGNNEGPSPALLVGYQRLPYADRRRVFSAILIACCDQENPAANTMINNALQTVHEAFETLIGVLSASNTKIVAASVDAKEMTCICIELLLGVVHAVDMTHLERIPLFLTPYMELLASLMQHFGDDLTVCEMLLRFFRDYTESFIAMLTTDQSQTLFASSAKLLKEYSAHQFSARAITTKKSSIEQDAEEEQAYTDILCAIQLMTNLGTRDFFDACAGGESSVGQQVTDMIFFGLQQIIPLMTQGLLQYPTLCLQFFELVGFMFETYPDKVALLPLPLLSQLIESLLVGMTHHTVRIANCSLQGISSLAKEQIHKQALSGHLQSNPDLLNNCTRQLLGSVILHGAVVNDRQDGAGMALLALVAVDLQRFGNLLTELCAGHAQEQRLQQAFGKLLARPDMLSRAFVKGHEGRMNRSAFKQLFGEFVHEVQSFLVIR